MATVFIDGQAGTTGLEIAQRLRARSDVTLLEIDEARRKDAEARRALIASADVTVLCLPDDASRQAVELAAGKGRILDASTAYRVDPEWTYGCPEMTPGQRAAIARARLVSNPGCYPQGFIFLIRPLIEQGLLADSVPLSVFGLSGFSGGGRSMIEKHQAFSTQEADRWNTRLYGLSLKHKHVPEMHTYSTTRAAPLFRPSVGNYYRGMLIEVPIFSSQLRKGTGIPDIQSTLSERYADEAFIEVLPANPMHVLNDGFLDPTFCNDSNNVQLMVFGNDEQILLVARYDNLGKGASGAAIQNLNLMLGVDEDLGLTS